jgi:hypothetical protein
MTALDHLDPRRIRDTRFLIFARLCANTAARDSDTRSASMLMTLLEEMRLAIAIRGCSFEHLQTAIAQCNPPAHASILDPIEDEPTRPDVPLSKAVNWWPFR